MRGDRTWDARVAATYVAGIVHSFGRKPPTTSTDTSPMTTPRPLTVALARAAGLAAIRAVLPRPAAIEGADDRIVDRVNGVVDGLPLATPLGFGAPFATRDGEVWLWTTERVAPGDQLAVTGRLRTPRGLLDPGAPPAPDRGVVELSAITLVHSGRAHTVRLDVLRWASEGSARCLGRRDIGTIALGRQADLAFYTLDELRFSGAGDPIAALILCGAHRADRVMVAGRWLVEDGAPLGVDVERLRYEHGAMARRFLD